MRLVIIVPVWRRPALTALCLDYLLRSTVPPLQELGISPAVLIGRSAGDGLPSEIASAPVAVERVVENEPLGRKYNDLFQVAGREMRADAAMLLGSDDFVSAAYIERAAELLFDGADLVTGTGCYFFDRLTHRLFHAQLRSLGAGSFYSARLIEAASWRPFYDSRSSGVDASLERAMRVHLPDMHARQVSVTPFSSEQIVDVKERACLPCGAMVKASVHTFEALYNGLTHKTEFFRARDYFEQRFPGLDIDALFADIDGDSGT